MAANNLFEHIATRLDDYSFIPTAAEQPTSCRPGSKDKLAVMMSRIAAGQELFDPSDYSNDSKTCRTLKDRIIASPYFGD